MNGLITALALVLVACACVMVSTCTIVSVNRMMAFIPPNTEKGE